MRGNHAAELGKYAPIWNPPTAPDTQKRSGVLLGPVPPYKDCVCISAAHTFPGAVLPRIPRRITTPSRKLIAIVDDAPLDVSVAVERSKRSSW